MKYKKIWLILVSVFILGFSFLIPCSSASTSISDEWHRIWGSADVEDHLRAIAIDSSDNIYCAGETVKFPHNLSMRDSKICLIKYDNTGILQWNQTWGGNKSDYCEAIALDSSGNIYVTGFTDSFRDDFGLYDINIPLLKYDDSGILQWSRLLGIGIDVRAGDIILDSKGNIYIAGDIKDFSVSKYLSCLLIKVNGSGIHQWNRTWGGSFTDIYTAIALDSSGNIYLAGSTDSFGAGESDICIVKYDNSGELQWNKTWGGIEDDRGYAIALDSSEDIYVAGITKSYAVQLENTQLLREDMCLLKYNSLGELQWNRTWGGTNMDFCSAMVIDSNDNIYLAGSAFVSGGGLDMCVVVYDSSGGFQWYKTWSGTTTDYGYAIALDSSENIYIGGSIKNYSMSENDMLMAKISKTSTTAIPGYDSLFMVCLICTVSVFLIKKRKKSLK